MKKKICFMILSFLVLISFCSCSNTDKIQSNQNSVEQSTNSDNSYKSQMDIAMKNANDKTPLAKVNDIQIMQTDKDVYLISCENYTTEEVVKMVVIEDYAKKNNLKINESAQNRIDSMRKSMEEDESLSDEYCLNTYGISKDEVIEYMTHRSEQLWLNSAFSDMVIEQVSSGECTKLYPCLQEAYKQFERDKSSKGSKAWDDIEEAYYEMIAKDYNIIIY